MRCSSGATHLWPLCFAIKLGSIHRRYREGVYNFPLAGFPQPSSVRPSCLDDHSVVDEAAGTRTYAGRGSCSNQRGWQQEFLSPCSN